MSGYIHMLAKRSVRHHDQRVRADFTTAWLSIGKHHGSTRLSFWRRRESGRVSIGKRRWSTRFSIRKHRKSSWHQKSTSQSEVRLHQVRSTIKKRIRKVTNLVRQWWAFSSTQGRYVIGTRSVKSITKFRLPSYWGACPWILHTLILPSAIPSSPWRSGPWSRKGYLRCLGMLAMSW